MMMIIANGPGNLSPTNSKTGTVANRTAPGHKTLETHTAETTGEKIGKKEKEMTGTVPVGMIGSREENRTAIDTRIEASENFTCACGNWI